MARNLSFLGLGAAVRRFGTSTVYTTSASISGTTSTWDTLRSVILRKLEGLAELVVTMGDVERTPGAVSAIINELAMNGINLRQLTSVGPGRIMMLVGEKDATEAYRALDSLSEGRR